MTTSPSLGTAYDPIGAHLQDPYPLYAQARREEPVFFSEKINAWVVTRYDDVLTVLRQPELYSSCNALPQVFTPAPEALAELQQGYPPVPSVITADGAEHERLRAALAPMFAPEQIRQLEPFILQQVTQLIDGFAEERHAELIADLAEPLPLRVVCHVCGLDDPDEVRVVHAGVTGLVALAGMPLTGAQQATAARQLVAMQHLVGRVIRARRAKPRQDLPSHLAATLFPGDQPLSFEQEAELVANVVEILVAGQITTSPLIGTTLRHMLEDPDRWRRLCAHPEQIPQAVEEVLRFDAPASGMYRQTTQPVTLGGARLPKDAKVVLRFTAANRDPVLADRAEELDLTRAPVRHLAFGFGGHYCLGAGLARTELAIALTQLTHRLPNLRLDPAHSVEIRAVHDLRGPARVPTVWE